MSEFPRDPKIIADLFLKKVLARMEANREATRLLSKAMPHIVNEAARPANSAAKAAKA